MNGQIMKQTFSNDKMVTQTLLAIMKTLLYEDINEIQQAKLFPQLSFDKDYSNLQLELYIKGTLMQI